jgi:hypothetical protein
MEPKIYSLIAAAAVGSLGKGTKLVEEPPCPACGYAPPPTCEHLQYVFDSWNGEDLVEALGCYAVSERLRTALMNARMTGFQTQDMEVSRSEYFLFGDEAPGDELPQFFQWIVTGRADGPDVWFKTTRCPVCGRRSGAPTDGGIKAMMGSNGPPLEVYSDSWQGDDAFRIEFIVPVLTERFTAVLEELDVKELSLKPAKWVARHSP